MAKAFDLKDNSVVVVVGSGAGGGEVDSSAMVLLDEIERLFVK